MRLFVRGLLGCLAVLAACWWWAAHVKGRGEDVVAEVEGQPITALELREALREHLWVRGESWAALDAETRRQTRQSVLERLINDSLIRFWRLRDVGGDIQAEARRETALLRRQFTDEADYERRLAGQHQTQETLGQAVRDAQLDEAWIAAKIDAWPQQDARAWYDAHKETLRIPQAHHAGHIFLTRHDATKPDREAEIRKIHRQLISKARTFATLAKEHSEDDRTKTLGGDLGWFTRQRMPADFVSAVEKLDVGAVGEPVLTALGWHIIRVYERRPSRLPTFEECRHEIATSLEAKGRETALSGLLADLRQRSSARIFYHRAVIGRIVPAA